MEPRHLITTDDLKKLWIHKLFDQATSLKADWLKNGKPRNDLQGKDIGLIFYENSTRTKASFSIAARRLGANPIALEAAFSSIQKGESLTDTATTLEAIGCHFLALRSSIGNGAAMVAEAVKEAHIINAGDGTNQHPTQALLDAFTLIEKRKSLNGLTALFVGDISHSRVARSAIGVLKTLGISRILISGPKQLIDANAQKELAATYVANLDDALPKADMIYALRIQFERHKKNLQIKSDAYRASYGLTQSRLAKLCKKDALIFHAGPMNVGIEIDRKVADSPNSCILNQLTNGVFIRMAILLALHENCPTK